MAQSSKPGFGAIPYDGGTTFRVWVPDVTSVSVAGSFNSWSATSHRLVKESGTDNWSLDVAGAKHDDEYKFVLNGNMWRQDPRSRRVYSSNPDDNSIVYDHRLFNWQDGGYIQIYRNDLVIYEMHVGSFNGESWLPSTFDQCIEKIPYLKKLGVSAIQLMPISEYATDRSWGYNPASLYSPESSLGGADGLKRFVKAAHEAGMAVLLDVVHNHYGPTDLALWQYNGQGGSTGGMYFYNDDRRYTDWGETRPNFDDENVRSFIIDNIRAWLEDFHIDGFRWDSVFNILYTGNGSSWNNNGFSLISYINDMMRTEFPDAFRIAEDHAQDGTNFEAQWDHTFLEEIRYLATAVNDAERNMDVLAGHLRDAGLHQVAYVESHDTCGDLNEGKARLPRAIDSSNPQSSHAKKRAFLANAVALTAPAIPMIFMGSEFNEDWNFSNNHSLQWTALARPNQGLIQAYSDLIRLRRNLKGVSGGFKDFSNASTPHVNNTDKLLGYARGNDLFVVFNWNYSSFGQYALSFPSSGTWYCLFNSDSKLYDASFGGVGPAVNQTVQASPGATVAIGGYSVQVYGKAPVPLDSTAIFNPAVPEGCTSVQLSYTAADGSLASATDVHAFIGINNWHSAVYVEMTKSGDTWVCDYAIPEDTVTLHVCFTGHDTTVWDNNDGLNWNAEVKNCGGLPSTVTVSPNPVEGCGTTVAVSYEVNSGPLYDSGTGVVFAQIGRNGWEDTQTLPMTNVLSDTWQTTYIVPEDTWSLSICFHDGNTNSEARIWDNNHSQNWIVPVLDCVVAPVPDFTITHPATPTSSVPSGVFAQTLAGTASHFTGGIQWTNDTTSGSGSFSVTGDGTWQAENIPLGTGTNHIVLTALNPNANAKDTDYSTIAIGINGGTGFLPWQLSTNAPAGTWGSSSGWGFWANKGGFMEAIRPFAAPLQIGDTVSFQFQNGSIDTGGSAGFGFYNRYGQRILEYFFAGGTSSYTLLADNTQTNTRSWTTNRQECALTLTADWAFSLKVDTKTYTGSLASTALDQIHYVRFWNYNAGEGSAHNMYVAALQVNGGPLLLPLLQRQVTLIQADNAVQAVALSMDAGGRLVATITGVPASQLQGNIWGASGFKANNPRQWDWQSLDGSYTIEGDRIILDLQDAAGSTVISIGRPGDMPE